MTINRYERLYFCVRIQPFVCVNTNMCYFFSYRRNFIRIETVVVNTYCRACLLNSQEICMKNYEILKFLCMLYLVFLCCISTFFLYLTVLIFSMPLLLLAQKLPFIFQKYLSVVLLPLNTNIVRKIQCLMLYREKYTF